LTEKIVHLYQGLRIIVITALLVLTFPLWLYRGVMYEILLPIYGKTTKAVLVGTTGLTSWSKYSFKIRSYFILSVRREKCMSIM